MKYAISPLLTASLVLCGCQATRETPHPDQHARVNVAIVQALNQSAIDRAVITQHTLYPYHFVPHSPQLNSLGQRDLNVLLGHYAAFPGPEQPLNVRQAETPDALYEQRVQSVADAIADAGIGQGNVEIRDDFPGGSGIASERVIVILAAERREALSGRRGVRINPEGGTAR